MQTKKEMLLDLLGQPSVQFVIPAYHRRANAHTDWANGKARGIISEKKLFGGE